MAAVDRALTIENHALAESTARALHSALLRLEPDQQRVLALRLVGLGIGEIGLILGNDRTWLDTTLAIAVHRLRELIGMSGIQALG
jgi:DNA-directed RNA polymerase specialized sigma24 family protein